MAAPLSPRERVRRLTALAERERTQSVEQIGADLGIQGDAMRAYRSAEIDTYGTVQAALEAATAELQDDDQRCAAAARHRANAKTLEAARLSFNEERGEAVGWSAFKRLLERAADLGLDGSAVEPTPPGQVIKGLSTMYVRDPQTGEMRESVQWRKTRTDVTDPADAIRRAAEALRTVTRLPPTPPPQKPMRAALLNHMVVTDVHLGQESDPREAGALWDLKEAERVVVGCADYLLGLAPPAQTLLLAFLGDYLDFEGPTPQTFVNRHPLPNKSSFPSMVEAGTRMARRLIDRGLATHDRVVVVCIDGNHDPVSAIWLRQLLAVAYEREPRVEVLHGEPMDAPHCAYRHGKVMLGYAHQHLTKSADLPAMFRDGYRRMFGETELAEIHCGHLHHFKVESYGAVKVIQHPTLAAKSRHIARMGWQSDRAMRLTTYHANGWRPFEGLVTPEMISAMAGAAE